MAVKTNNSATGATIDKEKQAAAEAERAKKAAAEKQRREEAEAKQKKINELEGKIKDKKNEIEVLKEKLKKYVEMKANIIEMQSELRSAMSILSDTKSQLDMSLKGNSGSIAKGKTAGTSTEIGLINTELGTIMGAIDPHITKIKKEIDEQLIKYNQLQTELHMLL